MLAGEPGRTKLATSGRQVLGEGRSLRDDDRRARRQRLQHAQPKALLKRRAQQNLANSVQAGQLSLRDGAKLHDARAQRRARAGSSDRESQRGRCRAPRCCRHRRSANAARVVRRNSGTSASSGAEAVLARLHAADAQHDAFVGRDGEARARRLLELLVRSEASNVHAVADDRASAPELALDVALAHSTHARHGVCFQDRTPLAVPQVRARRNAPSGAASAPAASASARLALPAGRSATRQSSAWYTSWRGRSAARPSATSRTRWPISASGSRRRLFCRASTRPGSPPRGTADRRLWTARTA